MRKCLGLFVGYLRAPALGYKSVRVPVSYENQICMSRPLLTSKFHALFRVNIRQKRVMAIRKASVVGGKENGRELWRRRKKGEEKGGREEYSCLLGCYC